MVEQQRNGVWLKEALEWLPTPTFGAILAFRLVNAFTLNTFFQADEYWQALEPAHAFVFGYGYLTWEWQLGLRSYLHPLIYMLPYWLVKSFESKMEDPYPFILAGPKLMNAIIAAVGDYYLYHLTLRLSEGKGRHFAKLVSFLSLFSAWNWYCWCRSFANSLELTLTIVSLYHLKSRHITLSLIISALTCIIRPTNAIIWLFYLPGVFLQFPKYIIIALLIAVGIIGLDGGLNYYFYSEFKLPLWEFFKFNVFDSLSSFYGVSRVDFYTFQAIPIIMLNYLPFFVYGVFTTPWTESKALIISYISIFTLIPHKEFRFIYPLMPFLLIYSASGVLKISTRVSNKMMKLIVITTMTLSVLLGYYFSQIHESGELQIPTTLRNLVLEDYHHNNIGKSSIGFLTPCHSTPFQSHFHLNESQADIWFLTCEPPLQRNLKPGISVQLYKDESDYFYDDPVQFLQNNFPALVNRTSAITPTGKDADWPHQWPEYLVMFANLWDNNSKLQELLTSNYEVVERLWNAPFHWDDRRTGDLLILKYSL